MRVLENFEVCAISTVRMRRSRNHRTVFDKEDLITHIVPLLISNGIGTTVSELGRAVIGGLFVRQNKYIGYMAMGTENLFQEDILHTSFGFTQGMRNEQLKEKLILKQ